MEITLSNPLQPQLPTSSQQPGSTTENSATSVLQKAVSVQPAKKVEQEAINTNPDQQKNDREAAVKKAAQMFKDFYPVSDVTFSIYKGSDGQYITRFTSLRNGKVTYIPEQDMFAYLKRAGRQYNNVQINA